MIALLRRQIPSAARYFVSRVVQSFWFTPLLLGGGGFALAYGALTIERLLVSFELMAPLTAPLDHGAAIAIMSTIATVSISATSIVYSLSLVIRSLAVSALGPRLIQNFRQNPITRLALGAQLAVFVFALTVLYRAGATEAVSHLMALVAIGGIVIAMALLVVFVNAIADQVRVDHIVGSVARDLSLLIDAQTADRRKETQIPEPVTQDGPVATARQASYIQYVDYEGLAANGALSGLDVSFLVRAGDFVIPGQPVAQLGKGTLTEEAAAAIDAAILYGRERTIAQDPLAQFNLVLEVALRALSPSMNDVFTAIACVHHIGAAFAQLDGAELAGGVVVDRQTGTVIRRRPVPFTTVLDAMLDPLRDPAARTVPMPTVILDMLGNLIATSRTEAVHAAYARHADLMVRAALDHSPLPEVRAELEAAGRRVARLAPFAQPMPGASVSPPRDAAEHALSR